MTVELKIFVFRGIAPRETNSYLLHQPLNFWNPTDTSSGSQEKFSEPFAMFCKTFSMLDSSSAYQEIILSLKNIKHLPNLLLYNYALSNNTTEMEKTNRRAWRGMSSIYPARVVFNIYPVLLYAFYLFLFKFYYIPIESYSLPS